MVRRFFCCVEAVLPCGVAALSPEGVFGRFVNRPYAPLVGAAIGRPLVILIERSESKKMTVPEPFILLFPLKMAHDFVKINIDIY